MLSSGPRMLVFLSYLSLKEHQRARLVRRAKRPLGPEATQEPDCQGQAAGQPLTSIVILASTLYTCVQAGLCD